MFKRKAQYMGQTELEGGTYHFEIRHVPDENLPGRFIPQIFIWRADATLDEELIQLEESL